MTEAQQETLYQRLGQEAAIKVVVDGLYERILSDSALVRYFDDTDMAAQKRHMAYFLTAATGGPDKYEGRDMAAAHEGLGITGEHWDLVIGHAAASLADAGVSGEEIAAVAGALAPLRAQVVTT